MDEKKLIEKLEEAIYEVEKYANPQIGAHDGRKRMAERVAGALAPKVKSILADEMQELRDKLVVEKARAALKEADK